MTEVHPHRAHPEEPIDIGHVTTAEPRDVIDLLVEDHRRLEGLLERLDEEQEPGELRLVFLQIVGELAAHEACEQQVVFPTLRQAVPAAEAEMLARLAEHEEVNELLEEMRGLVPSGLGFGKRASALLLELQAHFAEEEDIFERLRTALSHEELVDLAARARRAKCCAPAFPCS